MNTILKLSAAAGLLIIGVAGCNGGSGGSGGNVETFVQRDRLARPVVNEVFATVANNRHLINDTDNPTDDANQLKKDIESFLTSPAGRSRQIKDVIESVLVPDVMIVDLSKPGPPPSAPGTVTSYLGVETGGATGSTFGGRRLTDDVVDTSLAVVFGNAIPAITGVPDDGKEIPSLLSDNVGPGGKHYRATFPYLGNPR